MISEKYFKTLQDANFTSESIPIYRERINAEITKKGENASDELIYISDFLNSANAGALDMIAQGATFNFSDEIGAKFQKNFPQNFYVAVQNDAFNTYKAKNPIRASASQVVGAFVPTIIEGVYTATNARRGRVVPLFPERPMVQALTDKATKFVKNPLVRSGIYGTTYSVGVDEGTTKERLTKWRPYLTGLAAAGLAIPSVILSRLFGSIGEIVAQYPTQSEGKRLANQMLEEAMITDADSVEEALVIAHNAMNKNKQLTLADTGQSSAALLELVNTLPGKGSKIVRDFLEARAAGRFGRLNSDLVKAFGVEASYFETLDALIDERKRIAAPLYEEAFTQNLVDDSGTVIDTKPRTIDLDFEYEIVKNEDGTREVASVNDLLTRPSVKRAIVKAQEIGLEDGVQLPDVEITKGGLVITSGPNKGQLVDESDFKFMHYVKLALDNEISASRQPGATSLGNVELAKIVDTKNKFVSILDASNEAYRNARKTFAGSVALQESMDFGLNIFSKKTYEGNPELVISQMNASEKEAFRNGVFEAVLRKLDTSGENTNQALKIIGNKRNRDLLRLSFPDTYPEEQFQEFMANFTSEIESRAVEVQTLANSRTANRLALKEKFQDKSMRALQSTDLTPQGLINRMLRKDFAKLNYEQQEAMSERIAKILTETEYDRLVSNLRRGYTFGESFARVNPLKLGNFFKNLSELTNSPYVLGDLSSQVTDSLNLDYEEFGDAAKEKAIDFFTQDEQIKLETTSTDNARRSMPDSIAEQVLPQEKENIANRLDTMLANIKPSNIPLVPPATAVTPASMISETILPNPKDRELAERLAANKGGIGGLA
jgi:phosphopantetheinyl transferase (holo-ACP synthase)